MKKTLRAAAICAALLPASVLANAVQGDREVTLSGAGSSDKDFNNTLFSVDGSIGWYLSDRSAWGIRQQINVSDTERDSTNFSGATRVFYDYHFGEHVRPFIGVSIGGIYGDRVDDSFTAGPEIGLKYYIGTKTFIIGMMEYQFLFKNVDDADSRFDDGAFFYSLGLGYNF